MAHFPIFIDIAHKKCLVVGGGKVARRKVETLLCYEADVQVVAETICAEIRARLPEGAIREGKFSPADLKDAVLVVAASGDRELNRRVSELCGQNRIPVNVADAPEECTFLFPAVVKRDDISIGINTGGNSPALSGHIRQRIEEAVPESYGAVAAQLGALRERVLRDIDAEPIRRTILTEAAKEAVEKGRVLTPAELNAIWKRSEKGT